MILAWLGREHESLRTGMDAADICQLSAVILQGSMTGVAG